MFGFIGANSAQATVINASFEQIKAKDAFKLIAKHFSYGYLTRSEYDRTFDLSLTDASEEEALQILAEQTNLEVAKIKNTLILLPKADLELFEQIVSETYEEEVGEEPVSMNFSDTNLSGIIKIISKFTKTRIKLKLEDNCQIDIEMIDYPAGRVLQLLAALTGCKLISAQGELLFEKYQTD
jgi:hypothetical protein